MLFHSPRATALLALFLLIPLPTIGTLAGMTWTSTRGTPVGLGVYLFSKFWILALPIFWQFKVEQRWTPLGAIDRRSFCFAIGLGITLGAVITLGYVLLGRSWIDVEQMRNSAMAAGIGNAWAYIAFAVYLCTINAVIEEFVWRGFVSRQAGKLFPGSNLMPVLVSASAFTLHHVFALKAQFPWNVTILGSLGVFLGGVAWSGCYLRFRSIWPGFISHVIADFAILMIGWQLLFDSDA